MQVISVIHYSIHPLRTLATLDVKTRQAHLRNICQVITIKAENVTQVFQPCSETFQLCQSYRCLYVCELEIKAKGYMLISAACASDRAPLVFEFPEALVETGRTSDNHPALAGCNCLVWRKGEAANIAKSAKGLSIELRAKCFGGIFHNVKFVSLCDFE